MSETSVTPLMSLEPMGVGTPMVESLDSYAQRLAVAHRVPQYFIDALVNGGGNRIDRQKRSKKQICLDSPTLAAKKYALRLAQLTGRQEVGNLGLGALASTINLLRIKPVSVQWCPGCLWDMSNLGVPIYRPQLWSLSGYSICHVHEDFMETKCLRCRADCKSDATRPGPIDICHKCHRSLVLSSGNRPYHLTGRIASVRGTPQFRNSLALVELMTSLSTILSEGHAVEFDWNRLFAHCLEFEIVDTQAEMARLIGVSPSVITGLSTDKHLPSIASLVSMARLFGVHFPGLICPALWKVNTSAATYLSIGEDDDSSTSKPRASYDWEHIATVVRADIAAGSVDLPTIVARRMGICETHFTRKLPDLSHQMRMAKKKKLADEKNAEYLRIKELLGRRFKCEIAANIKVCRKEVWKSLNVSVHNQAFRRAWVEVFG